MFDYEGQFARMDKICQERGGTLTWSFERSHKRDDEFMILFKQSSNGNWFRAFTGRVVDDIFDAAEEWFAKHDSKSIAAS